MIVNGDNAVKDSQPLLEKLSSKSQAPSITTQQNDSGMASGVSVQGVFYQSTVFSFESVGQVFAAKAESYVAFKTGVDSMFEQVSGSISQLADRLLGQFNQFLQVGESDADTAAGDFMSYVDEGFVEAEKLVSQTQGMDEGLKEEAGAQYSQVQRGVEQRVAQERVVQSVAEDDAIKVDEVDEVDDGVGGATGASASMAAYASEQRARSFEFELTTRDGDVVSISMASLVGREAGFLGASSGSGGSALFGQAFNQGAYSLEIDGELDEGELQAIKDLLSQITEISEFFFDGDFEKAFEGALALGFDGGEIAGFSLDLLQVERQQVGAYVGREGASKGGFAPLAQMAEKFVDMAEVASPFEFESNKLSKLLGDGVFERGMRERGDELFASKYEDLIQGFLDRL